MEAAAHAPVLLAEALENLALRADGTYLDCTFGRGGHSREILRRLGPRGRLLAIDRDEEALAAGAALQAEDARFTLFHARFSTIDTLLAPEQRDGGLDGVLLDLGVSSPQLDTPTRGFSFQTDGPLDMRMDTSTGEPVSAWLARVDQVEIARCLFEFGEERHSRRIARRICAVREQEPITTTGQLARLVAGAVPRSGERIHPATRTFQALRIQINDELGEIERGLPRLKAALAPAGRLCAISFHSLEDRIVKRYFRDSARPPEHGSTEPRRYQLVTRKPIYPTDAECAVNPRSRSARLRVLERVA